MPKPYMLIYIAGAKPGTPEGEKIKDRIRENNKAIRNARRANQRKFKGTPQRSKRGWFK